MKVKELISELQKCNPNRDVIFCNDYAGDNINIVTCKIDYCNEDTDNEYHVILGTIL